MLLLAIGATTAEGHQNPPGCTTNGLQLTLTKDRTTVRQGDVINYTVSASNDEPGSCDLTGVTISLTLPAAAGTPTGPSVTLASNVNYPAGTAQTVVGTAAYTVALNPGVTDAVAEATANGVLHDAPVDHAAQITKTVGTTVSQPHLTLTETATPVQGRPPFETQFDYTLVNDSTTNVPVANPRVSDDRCSEITLTGGDANGNGLLDVGESWMYSCTRTIATAGTFASTATATGTSTVDNQALSVTGATVTIRSVLPSRATVLRTKLPSVRSDAARRNAACIPTPKRLSLRAGELTVIQVRVRRLGENVQRALVRVTGPGFVRRATTNAKGVATFSVRPRRAGVLVIQSDQCIGADRATVRAAHVVSRGAIPRTTG